MGRLRNSSAIVTLYSLLCVKESYKNNKRLPCIKRLLQAGSPINTFGEIHKNTLGILKVSKATYQEQMDYKDTTTLLYAAGEALEGAGAGADEIPEELKFEDEKLRLKHICREAIRKHLLKPGPAHHNLFGRILKLGLPSDRITEYLLVQCVTGCRHHVL